jgi:hypothetical protein
VCNASLNLLQQTNFIPSEDRFKAALRLLCKSFPSDDVCLIIDEIDNPPMPIISSILLQLRDGYNNNKTKGSFPTSCFISGVRNVIKLETQDGKHLGGSAFNIAEAVKFLRFDTQRVKALLSQHKEHTFDDSAITKLMDWSNGQPWLVNKLASDCVTIASSKSISSKLVNTVANKLLVEYPTHVAQMFNVFTSHPELQPIASSLIACSELPSTSTEEQLDLLEDYGVIRFDSSDRSTPRISSRFYEEALPRLFTRKPAFSRQVTTLNSSAFIQNDQLLVGDLLKSFQKHCRHRLDSFVDENQSYKEAAIHFILFTFLQRVVNGGGQLSREYHLGRNRVDIFVEFHGSSYVIELKTVKDCSDNHKIKEEKKAVEQVKGYLKQAGLPHQCGFVVIWDQRKLSWDQKISTDQIDGISVYRC